MINISFDEIGMDEAFQLMDRLKKFGAVTNGVRLIGKAREENAKITNSDILRWQAKQKRDIITPSQVDINQIGKRFVEVFNLAIADRQARESKFSKQAQKWSDQQLFSPWSPGQTGPGKLVKQPVPLAENDKWANATNGQCLRESMKKAMELMQIRHEFEVSNNPPYNRELTPSYERWKEKTFGFSHPTLKATGQLTDAINPTGPGGRNIRLEREVTKSADDRITEWGKNAMSFGKTWLKR